jgi:hypothetical protein
VGGICTINSESCQNIIAARNIYCRDRVTGPVKSETSEVVGVTKNVDIDDSIAIAHHHGGDEGVVHTVDVEVYQAVVSLGDDSSDEGGGAVGEESQLRTVTHSDNPSKKCTHIVGN